MDNPTRRDHHHAGMTVQSSYTNYIPSTNDQSSHSAEKQQSLNQPRKRTRATPEQLSILEKTFSVNPSPNNRVREQLSRELGMSERSIQIWFQNRRAKVKNMAKRSSVLHDETMRMQYYAATAAAAACQAANSQQQKQHTSPDGTPVSNTDLYYYYYYYYYNQQQQQQQQQGYYGVGNVPLKTSNQATPPPPPPMPNTTQAKPWTSLSTPPPSSISPSSSTPISMYHQQQQQQQQQSLGSSNPLSFNSPITAHVSDTVGGRIRSHSVGHYPYNPYQRNRPGSSEPVNLRRHYSTSASPAPPSINLWPSMLGPNGIIPEEQVTTMGYDWSSMDPSILPNSLVQDERSGTPMSMDEFTVAEEDESNQYRMSVEALEIGTWKRMSLQPHDLECFYDQSLRCMVWRIQDGLQRFKMHIKVDSIKKVQLDPLLERLGWARLSLTVIQPETICFYMEEGAGGERWTQCRDFTQDRQATTIHTHYIDGPALALRAEWMRLVAQDQHLHDLFQNNMVQPSHPMYHTARGPHGQSMLTRQVTPADMMVQQHDDPSMLSLMNQDKDLLLFQGV